jgi:hypothetical protein
MDMSKKKTTLQIPNSLPGTLISGSSSNISITTSGTNLVYNGSSLITNQKNIYHILGEDVEVSNGGYYKDTNLITNISILNVLGKPFLDELHKNGAFFPTEIEDYLEKKFKWLERDKKIDDIIN